LGIVGGLFVLCGGAVGVIVLTARLGGEPSQPPRATSGLIQPEGGRVGDRDKKYTREEFKKLAIGKTPDQLIATLGRPTSTEDYRDGSPRRWYYYGRALNPATGEYSGAWIDFADGKAIDVDW
jgi:hypothetical protein